MSISTKRITRRRWLVRKLMDQANATVLDANRAVDVMAAEHPELDFDEKHTWKGWEAHDRARSGT